MPDSSRQASDSERAEAAQPADHRAVIALWPSLGEYADDIGAEYGTAKQHRRRNSIPDAYRSAVVSAARRRKFAGISFELLTKTAPDIRARRKQPVAAEAAHG